MWLHVDFRRMALSGAAFWSALFATPGTSSFMIWRLHRTMPAQEKYNAAQQMSISAIVVMGAGSVLTGLAIYKPAQLCLAGRIVRRLPRALALLILPHHRLSPLFFVVHIAQVALAGWNNFRGMVIGYELVKDNE